MVVFLKDRADASKNPRVKVGEGSYGLDKGGMPGMFPESPYKIEIGSYTSIGARVELKMHVGHRMDFFSTYPFALIPSENGQKKWPEAPNLPRVELCPAKGDIIIGSDVWIGDDAKILSGITIGHGAVIGTGAIVTKDIPPYAIAVGNPAKVIKYRFNVAIISKFLDIAWWNWPEEKIREALPLLSNVPAFIEKYWQPK
jgi:virginiamycin A acetyltransferase